MHGILYVDALFDDLDLDATYVTVGRQRLKINVELSQQLSKQSTLNLLQSRALFFNINLSYMTLTLKASIWFDHRVSLSPFAQFSQTKKGTEE